jgi:FHA domain
MSFYQLLPSFSEAFVRLAQTRDKGCLVVFNSQDAIHLFVQDGLVVAATSGKKDGETALELAFESKGSSYGWIAGAEPPKKNLNIDMPNFLHVKGIGMNAPSGKTIRMPTMPQAADRKERKLEANYFFIPEESPTFKLRVKKVTNVVGREGTCDVYVESSQVSRRHCLLQVTERGLLVKDLESTNGTFVNGIPMTDGYINAGDRLGLGTYVMTLHREKI